MQSLAQLQFRLNLQTTARLHRNLVRYYVRTAMQHPLSPGDACSIEYIKYIIKNILTYPTDEQ